MRRMCDANVSRLCHHAFLHTTSLISAPLLHMKKTCLPGLLCPVAFVLFRKTKPYNTSLCKLPHSSYDDDVILFCAVLCRSRAGGLYILCDTEPSHEEIALERLVGKRKLEPFSSPTPIEGEGGGDKTNLSNSTFFCLETLG